MEKAKVQCGPGAYRKELFLFSVLFVPNLAALFLSSDLKESWIMQGGYLCFACMLWVFPFLILKKRTAFLCLGMFLVVSPLEIGHLYYMGLSATPTMLRTILSSNPGEVREFLGNVCWVLLPFLALCAYYFYLAIRIPNRYLFPRRIRGILFGVFLLFNLALYARMWNLVPPQQASGRLQIAQHNFVKKYYKVYPFSIFHATQRAVKNQWRMRNFSEELRMFRFDASVEKSKQRRIVVWVMGESSRYDHYSVNGYLRPTSPKLAALPGLVSYSQMYAEANLTELSLLFNLTQATPHDPERAWREKTILDLFSEVGFRTAWIANQSAENLFVARAAADADYAYFATVDFDANGNYDGNLLPKLEEVLQQKGDLFLFVHLLGSHFRYNFRYPPEFTRFTPTLKGTESYSVIRRENKELLVNSYDNTIVYTDSVLDALIRLVDNQQSASVVLYTSDHGEALFDDANTGGGHPNTPPSVHELHVPLFLWTSGAYDRLYPDRRRNMEKHRDCLVNSSNLFYSVADLVPLHFAGQRPQKSIVSDEFVPDTATYVRTVNEQVLQVR